MNDIIIAGYGIVGSNLYNFFNKSPRLYDPIKNLLLDNTACDIAFICVPTDNVDNVCDLSSVKNCLSVIQANIYVIKSTIPPGTTEALAAETGKAILFSPEYYGNTPNNKGLNQGFVILGGVRPYTDTVAQLFMHHTPSNFKIEITDAITAELVKYMENAFIATKVSFMNEFYRISRLFQLDFQRVRSLFLMDERFSPFFTYVFEDQPYYDSHCLNKDLPALISHLNKLKNYNPKLLESIVEINSRWKEEYQQERNI